MFWLLVGGGAVLSECAVKLRRSGRRYKALTPQESIRGFLLFDVLPNDGEGCSSRRSGKITGGPEAATPQRSLNAGIVLLPDQAGGDAFEAIHQARNGHLRRVGDQQMHMIPLAVEFFQGRFEVLAHVGKDGSQVLQDFFREDQPPIFGHEHQMHMQVEDAMSASAIVA